MQCFRANNTIIAVRDTLEKSENDEFIASLNNVKHQEIHPLPVNARITPLNYLRALFGKFFSPSMSLGNILIVNLQVVARYCTDKSRSQL